jgi:cold-inducible RNA-binding protein
MQQRRGVQRDGGMSAHQPSYSYQNAQYQKYAPNGAPGSGAKARHYNYHQNDCKVYVGGLPQQISEADLRGRMSDFGTVQQVNIIYDEQGHSRGFGFVTYRNSEEAKSALGVIDLYGKSVEVKYSNKNANVHQNEYRQRNQAGEYLNSDRQPTNGYGAPYPYQYPTKPQKYSDPEFLHHVEHPETLLNDAYQQPSSGSLADQIVQPQLSPVSVSQKSLSKKLLRKSSQQFEFQGGDKESQKVLTSTEKQHTTSEASTRYTDSLDNESTYTGSLFPTKGGHELSAKSAVFHETSSVGLNSKKSEEPHRTISKHSNPYHPPVSSMPSVMPPSVAMSPSVASMEYNPQNFGIYFNPQQNMYTQPGMGFMMNQFMNFGPVFEPVAAVDYPRPANHSAHDDSPSLPAVEMRIHFYTFPGRV